MPITKKELMTIIETLPIEMKIELIEKLLYSLHSPQKEIDELWIKESEKRLKEIKDGKVELIPIQEVFERVFKKYGK